MSGLEPTKSQIGTIPKRSRSITFRLDAEVIEELQREADLKEVSLNVLVNQILRRYAKWDRFENSLGMMPVPKIILTKLANKTMKLAADAKILNMDSYRDEIVRDCAENAFSLIKDSVLMMKKKYNLWTVLSVLQEYMKISGITSDHIEEGGKHVFIIQHELGEIWSLFAKELLSLIFTKLAEIRADISTTPNLVKAEVIL
ncbi:MAG: hypothetical protein WB511_08370 [Nitrososphaeraceae archaeon]